VNSGDDGVKCLATTIADKAEGDEDRMTAIGAIALMGPSGKAATPALLCVLNEPTRRPDIKQRVIVALRCIGPGAQPAADELRRMLATTKNARLRQEIEATLAALVGN